MQIIVVGGGAAGYFGAIAIAQANPACKVTIVERGNAVLQKVKVSGGGRCNVTHACFDPRELTRFYPRGGKELAGPFSRFGPAQTIEWFETRGVALKTESDGRMFPTTNLSQTIMDCLQQEAQKLGISVQLGTRMEAIAPLPDGRWHIGVTGRAGWVADKVLVATGSSEAIWDMLAQLGHTIISPVPSLFTFNTKDRRLRDLAGLAVPFAHVSVPALKLEAQGPLLITHWGLSGPAILRLSAWGARSLFEQNYRFDLKINWVGDRDSAEVLEDIYAIKAENAKKMVVSHAHLGLPNRLWQHLCEAVEIPPTLRWADAGKKLLAELAEQLCAGKFAISGKSTFKEEFVTAGGVDLKEVNFKTFESKIFPGLFFAGEVLNIDAITGGFNFQAAWTGGWIAGNNIGAQL